jgi:hypothetical protein
MDVTFMQESKKRTRYIDPARAHMAQNGLICRKFC